MSSSQPRPSSYTTTSTNMDSTSNIDLNSTTTGIYLCANQEGFSWSSSSCESFETIGTDITTTFDINVDRQDFNEYYRRLTFDLENSSSDFVTRIKGGGLDLENKIASGKTPSATNITPFVIYQSNQMQQSGNNTGGFVDANQLALMQNVYTQLVSSRLLVISFIFK